MNKTLFTLLFLFLFSIGNTFAQESEPQVFNLVKIGEVNVYGKSVDNQTRCVHWHSQLDIIAIKFKCCDKYYPCFSCHEEEADHEHEVWPKDEFDEKAILCGGCGHELSIREYMDSENTCPKCEASFNPGCSNHYHLYFDVATKAGRR
ncbi:chromophore lyase [Litoribacter alkaliphilus]|uniref:Chromophore lyase n=1 Tax=Litoribacter ruber TaxID=702568 RepID=A0AAP2CJB3_9BACT|nr:CHY zinc finger protein [Litoribacter alkaliphilus]MBS9525796.1 chromophore lyase [Litoribacter alkaliphilus]